MAQKLPPFLKHGKNNSVLFANSGHMTYFIPEDYFTKGYAEIDGEYIKLIGTFSYAIYDEKGKPIGGLKLFNFPSNFVCLPGEIKKEKDLKLTNNNKAEDYRLLIFKKDDMAIVSTKVPMLVDNVEEFFRMMTTGTIPNNVPYDKLQDVIINNSNINGYDYQVPIGLIGIIQSEICRSKTDKSKAFRHSGSTDMTAYDAVNIKDIPNLVSAFTAITSENWDESIGNAMVNKNHKYSPLEKLFMG